MNSLFLLCTVFIFSIQTLCFKKFNSTYMKNLASYFVFNFLCSLFIVAIFLVSAGSRATFHTPTVLMGIGFGIMYVTTILCYTKAMEKGPLSFTMLFFSSGMLIPIVQGVLFYDEKASILQMTGLVLLLITFYLGSGSNKTGNAKVNISWLVLCLATFISNGSLGAFSKVQQIQMPNREVNEFLVVAFATSALISLFFLAGYLYIGHQSITHTLKPGFLVVIIGAGASTGFGNQLVLYLISRVPAIILFPLMNGGAVLLTTVISVLFFKEKLSKKAAAAFVLGISALVLLGLR